MSDVMPPLALVPGLWRRFWAKVDPTGDCWEWLAYKDGCGYGVLGISGKSRKAHRTSWEMLVGAIPEGMEIDHRCFNPGCVNPDHMEVVTPAVNKSRARKASLKHTNHGGNSLKTHCPQGHAYTPENTYRSNSDRPHRMCITCTTARNKARVLLRRSGAVPA